MEEFVSAITVAAIVDVAANSNRCVASDSSWHRTASLYRPDTVPAKMSLDVNGSNYPHHSY